MHSFSFPLYIRFQRVDFQIYYCAYAVLISNLNTTVEQKYQYWQYSVVENNSETMLSRSWNDRIIKGKNEKSPVENTPHKNIIVLAQVEVWAFIPKKQKFER